MREVRFCQAEAGQTKGRLGALTGLLLAATTVVGSAQLSAPPPPRAPAPKEQIAKPPEPPADPVLEMPIELLAGRPIVRAMINGQGPFAFLIDPLAPRVLIDPTLVEALALKTQPGTVERVEVHIDIGLGSTMFLGIAAEVANTGRFVAGIGPAGQPRGVLNASLWKDHLLTVDFGRRKLRVAPGTLPDANDKEIFAMQAPSGDLVVPLRVNGQSIACHIDPMGPHGLVLPASYLADVSIQKASLRDVPRVQLRGATVPGKEAKLTADVTVATFDVEQPIVEFGEIGDVAQLGSRWLVEFALTYDVTNRRVRLERAPRPLPDR